VLGLGLASLGTVGDLFRRVADVYVAAPAVDSVTEFTSRFDGLRQMLPSKGNIGYMTDPDTPAEDANALAEFHLAQYALAPVIVVRSDQQRYVVANFHRQVSTGSLKDRGLVLVREFGKGIALFENERMRGSGR
jgi:hypothetical protein